MRRKCKYQNEYNYRQSIGESNDVWYDGYCLLITGGMMNGETSVIERMDGTMISLSIQYVKFNDALVGQDGGAE